MTATIQPFDFTTDEMKAILWQYDSAPNTKALVQSKQDFYDQNQTQFWNDYLANIFDLETADDFGLAVWSIILDAPIAYIVTSGGIPSWGFGTYHVNFTQGNFLGQNGSNSTYALSTETARVILQLRYFMLTGTCTIPAINRMLKYIFFDDYGPAYITDGHDMTQRYVFGFALPSDMQYAFNNFDVLPRPAGVGSTYTIFVEAPWGFNTDASNFNNSNFWDE